MNINTLVVLFSFFLSNLTCCICAKQNLHSQYVYCNISYVIILPYCNICLEMLLKLSKKWENIPYIPGLYGVFVISLCFWMTKYIQFLKPVGKVGGEMAWTHIRHVLQTRIRTFIYNGVVYLSAFKMYQNK